MSIRRPALFAALFALFGAVVAIPSFAQAPASVPTVAYSATLPKNSKATITIKRGDQTIVVTAGQTANVQPGDQVEVTGGQVTFADASGNSVAAGNGVTFSVSADPNGGTQVAFVSGGVNNASLTVTGAAGFQTTLTGSGQSASIGTDGNLTATGTSIMPSGGTGGPGFGGTGGTTQLGGNDAQQQTKTVVSPSST